MFVLHVTEWALRYQTSREVRQRILSDVQPSSRSANAACIIVPRCPSLWVVELQLRECAASTNHVPLKAVKRVYSPTPR